MYSASSSSCDVRREASKRGDGSELNVLFVSFLLIEGDADESWTCYQCKLGGTVGYAIRFEDCTSKETKIKCRCMYPVVAVCVKTVMMADCITTNRHDRWSPAP